MPHHPRKKTIHGGGTVYQRKSDGRYVASIMNPETGRPIERYARTEKEAEKKLEDIKYELRQRTLATGPQQTVKQFLERWFEDVHKHQVRETTLYHHKIILNKHLLPTLGHIQLRKLTPVHVQGLYANKLKEGMNPNSLYNVHAVLHRALKDALRWQYVSQNVCDMVSLPSEIEPESHALTIDQAIQLLKAAQGDPLETFVNLAMTGMRHGEMLALRWDDIDFEERCLQVRRTVVYVGGKYIVGEPKTKKSKREVMLPFFVVEKLLQHKECQQEKRSHAGEQWQNSDLVFCNDNGNFISPDTNRDRFYRLLESAKLPRIRIHDLRHTASTLLSLEMNEPEKLVQELLGHEKVEMTRERYTHAQRKMLRKMMDNMDEFFRRFF